VDLGAERTKISVDGRATTPAELKVGMACDLRHLDEGAGSPMEISCSTGTNR